MTRFRSLLVAAAMVALCAVQARAQTTLNSTTFSSAITDPSAQYVALTSVTNIAVNDLLFADREFMEVQSIDTTAKIARVSRGVQSMATTHPTLALVYSGVRSRFYGSVPRGGSCTRASEQYLPRIVMSTGDVWDCPVGAQVWTHLNATSTLTVRSVQFNLDNGGGTTLDALLIRPTRPIAITACRIVYDDATTGTVATGSASVGTTVGGVDVVALTNYENTKAVGTTTAMVIVNGLIAANAPVLVRHTGVAATQAGMAVVECDFNYR